MLEILDRIAHVGEYYGEQDKNVISKHAFNIRYAYFDHARELVDAIPEPLLVRVSDSGGVHPEEDFADLISRRKDSRAVAGGTKGADDATERGERPTVGKPKGNS